MILSKWEMYKCIHPFIEPAIIDVYGNICSAMDVKKREQCDEPSTTNEQRLRSGVRPAIEVGIEWTLLVCFLSRQTPRGGIINS